ncbi:polysaccharide deacetylase family protein [Pelosinus sp. UFO1]|uniref:polysaccharide deacetylase family protein n=1 Tax=Pelosinus sp. UFO1 TaxID=484770 RepID=UPI0004D1053E|nr:polysaccharide deacetylase family protein [Pelosinus sp. UFO1]AIF51912.1 polysaccharide deacetylase [Pelosinus sp. UFO1]
MVKKYSLFSIFGLIVIISFICFVSTPLSLAIPALQQTSPPTPASEISSSPDVYYITETANIVPTNEKPEYDIFTNKEREERQLSTVLPIIEPYYESKRVYLTFDDGPDPENTPLVLAILKENNIKATFFLVGTEIEKYPDIVKQIFMEGHAIGNHTYNHTYRDLYQSPTTYTEQLNLNDTIIKNILTVRPRISRAPGGSAGHFTKEYWSALKRQGYIEVGWNISSGDASAAKANDILNNIMYQTTKNTFLWDHAIVLLHDGRGHAESVKALPSVIKFYKEQGFQFHVINAKTPPAW